MTQLGARIGVAESSLKNAKSRGSEPSAEVIRATGEQWPEYAYWLLTGKTDAEHGHHSPETKHGT